MSEWELPYAKWFLGGTLNVAYNCLDRHVEAGRGDRVAYFWEGEPEGDRATLTYAELLAARCRDGKRPEAARRRQGDEGRDLHGDGARAPDRDARVHPPRRAAHGRLRRLLGRLALRPRERHGLRGADHPGRGLAPRLDRAAEAHRRRGDGRGARDPRLPRRPAHGQRGADAGRARSLAARLRRLRTTRRRAPASRWTRRTSSS